MEVTVDKFGRIVVPKNLRDSLGIAPGMRLEIEQIGREILLRLPAEASNLRDEGGVLVYCGRLIGDVEETIQQVREQRHRQIIG